MNEALCKPIESHFQPLAKAPFIPTATSTPDSNKDTNTTTKKHSMLSLDAGKSHDDEADGEVLYNRPIKKNADNWRTTKRIVGGIVGLPGSHGVLVATDGILCLIERIGQPPFEGHLDWFLSDDKAHRQLVKALCVGGRSKATKVVKAPKALGLEDFDV